jgi:hypothetical protein
MAAVIYRTSWAPPSGSCRVAVADLVGGAAAAAVRTLPLCQNGEIATGALVDVDPVSGRALLYAGLARYRPAGAVATDDRAVTGGGRVVAVDLATGAVVAVFPLASGPGPLALGPVPAAGAAEAGGGPARQLYVVENVSGLEDEHAGAHGWRLVGLSTPDLAPATVLPLTGGARRLAATPNGEATYVLEASGSAVNEIRVARRDERPLARLPGPALDLLVTHDRMYVADPSGTGLWAIERRGGRVSSVAVGQGLLALARAGL